MKAWIAKHIRENWRRKLQITRGRVWWSFKRSDYRVTACWAWRLERYTRWWWV